MCYMWFIIFSFCTLKKIFPFILEPTLKTPLKKPVTKKIVKKKKKEIQKEEPGTRICLVAMLPGCKTDKAHIFHWLKK